MSEKRSIFDMDEVTTTSKSEDLSVNDMLKNIDKSKRETKNVKEETPKKEESPLDKLMKERENEIKGEVYSNELLDKLSDKGPTKDIIHNDERMKDFQKAIDELDETTKKRNAVVLKKQPSDDEGLEFTQLMLDIDSVKFDENGNAYFGKNADGSYILETEFCRIRKDDEDIYDFTEIENKIKEAKEEQEEETEKSKDVQIIIDKTGLGTDVLFTDEERKKIEHANVIRVKEVETVDIAMLKQKRSPRSFQEAIHTYSLGGEARTMTFPASGFRAKMKGLTYGEYADLTLSMDNVTFDQYHKRLSVIYNKMESPTCGKFESFDDFLKSFAYTDISVAIYGLYLATEHEEQSMPITCGRQDCRKTFNWDFKTTTLLRLEDCGDTFVKKMKELIVAPPIEYDRIRKESAVLNSKYIKLPDSNFIVELGIASAYDFLYNFIPLMNEDTYHEMFGEDLDEDNMNNILLLTSLRSVWVPDANDTFIECTTAKDILDAIYKISPEDLKIVTAYVAKYQEEYSVSFGIANVECPHCGQKTKLVDVSIDELVFQTYQRLRSIDVDLTTLQGL